MHLNPHAKCRSSKFNLKLFKKEKRGSLITWKHYSCALLDADLFLFCYERDFMLSLSDNNQADIIEAFDN